MLWTSYTLHYPSIPHGVCWDDHWYKLEHGTVTHVTLSQHAPVNTLGDNQVIANRHEISETHSPWNIHFVRLGSLDPNLTYMSLSGGLCFWEQLLNMLCRLTQTERIVRAGDQSSASIERQMWPLAYTWGWTGMEGAKKTTCMQECVEGWVQRPLSSLVLSSLSYTHTTHTHNLRQENQTDTSPWTWRILWNALHCIVSLLRHPY